MCANAVPTTSLSPFTSSSRSFFSRLTSPLKARSRNLTDFYIRPDEPHRKYSPGDLVKGAVVLTVVKPVRLTHLTVCLHGFVRVFKSPAAALEPLPDLGLTASSNPNKSQYFGNGHASLFRDEATLCGEGRLDIGVYEFNFELEFPAKGIPTSIDFERGTISYLITATITRPTSITATASCDKKISLVESVDVGLLPPPKPRTISLEPISRRPRKRQSGKTKQSGSQESTDAGSVIEAPRAASSPLPDDSASQCGSVEYHVTPRSPVPSDIQSTVSATNSVDSTVSNSTGHSFRLGPVPSSAMSKRDSPRNSSKLSLADQTITAEFQLLKSGCLPGDTLRIKLSIKHTKAIKSLHGIIVTLYRSGRVDSAPPLSLFADLKGKDIERIKHEEYYPKSKTGLGGLSLSSAGSSSMFRKDLAQTFAPILVDPVTLTANVNASVRVPEHVFPTISGVPGEMISFKYHVEVVVDLGGKLAGQQRHIPRLGAVSSTARDPNTHMLTTWGGGIVDTANIRREKSVVACLFEVVVGTTDSARQRGRGNSTVRSPIDTWSEQASVHAPSGPEPIYEESYNQGHEDAYHRQEPDYYDNQDQPYNSQYQEYYPPDNYDYQDYYPGQYPPPTLDPIEVPPPEMQHEEGLSDKERARRAEQLLLPSQPPVEVGPPSLSTVVPRIPPSAVPPDAREDLYSADDVTPVVSTGHSHVPHNNINDTMAPSAPALEDLGPVAGSRPTEDKQELERQRLMAEASAPSEIPDDEENNASEGSSWVQHEPSAPEIADEDHSGGQCPHYDLPGPSSRHETLPAYER